MMEKDEDGFAMVTNGGCIIVLAAGCISVMMQCSAVDGRFGPKTIPA